MNAIERLKDKLAAAEQERDKQRIWLHLFCKWVFLWAFMAIPLTLVTAEERGYGAGITIFFAVTALLAVVADRVASKRVSEKNKEVS